MRDFAGQDRNKAQARALGERTAKEGRDRGEEVSRRRASDEAK